MVQGFHRAAVAPERTLSRRRCLKMMGLAVGTGLSSYFPLARVASAADRDKKLALHNLHTGEAFEMVYWTQGTYLPEALQRINHLLRDYRTDEIKQIDPRLLDLLSTVYRQMDTSRPFEVFSGYRSPATNELLRQHSNGVAKNSMHLQGKAIDIRLPGRKISALRRAAVALHAGGVGYYPRSQFIHIDTGPVRYW